MIKSESIANISKALVKAQKAMGGAAKGSNNPYFKSRYADYGAVLEACKDALNDNGIAILQPHDPVVVNGKNYVETVLLHESGEFISGLTEIVCAKDNDPQALGSATTYARRFGLESIVALPREDDDGNAASGKTVTQAAPPKLDVKKAQAAAEKAANVAKQEEKPAAKVATPVTKTEEKKAEAAKPVTGFAGPTKPATKPAVAKKLEEGW